MKSKDSILDLAYRILGAISTIALILITCAGTAYLLGELIKFIYHLFGATL